MGKYKLLDMLEAVIADPIPRSLEEALSADIAEVPPVIGDILEAVKGLRAIAERHYVLGLARIVLQAGPLPQIPLFNTLVYMYYRSRGVVGGGD